MAETTIEKLGDFGQSVWLDNISRSIIESGRLKDMIGLGLRGMTSNPTIFDKAISSSGDYDETIDSLYNSGKSVFQIYDELTVKDVQDAADIFRPVYNRTHGLDGYVSLEVNPKLAFRAEETVEEACRLFKKVARPNVMFKVPSTDAGFKAMEELIARGININATLIFSLGQYMKTARAFIKGMNRFLEKGGDLKVIRSVASVFVSRVDTLADKMIDAEGNTGLNLLKGKLAAANSALIYKKYFEIFSGSEFKKLKAKGTNVQRVLWASTSTKNPDYSDIKYVTELIAEGTVNTMPKNTFEAFLDHGIIKENLTSEVSEAEGVIRDLKNSEIDLDSVCAKLLDEGIVSFEKSFESLLSSIEEKAKRLSGERV